MDRIGADFLAMFDLYLQLTEKETKQSTLIL